MTGLQEHYPDPNRAAIGDLQTRNVYFRANLNPGTDTTLTTDEPARIRSVEVSGGTATVQVQVDGRDVFEDANRPVSDTGMAYPTDTYIFNAGSVISTIIEDGAGPATVEIEMEPYTLADRTPQVTPHGPNRKRPSSRARIKEFNAAGSLVPSIVTKRIVGHPDTMGPMTPQTWTWTHPKDVVVRWYARKA